MKSAISLVLVLSLVALSATVSAQDLATRALGPIARSIPAEAAKLAAVQMKHADDGGWEQVRKLASDTEVVVLDNQGTRIRGRFVEADETAVLVRDGAFSNRVSRAAVVEIAAVGPGKGSALAAAGFAVAGGLAALLIDGGLMMARCDNSCGGVAATMIGVSVGLPLAAGYGGYYGFRKPAQRLIYRAVD